MCDAYVEFYEESMSVALSILHVSEVIRHLSFLSDFSRLA